MYLVRLISLAAYTLTKSSTVLDAIGAAGSFNWDTAKKKFT